MRFFLIIGLITVSLLAGSAYALDFYQGTVSSEFRKYRGYPSSQQEAQVSYAREDNRFVLVVSIGELDPDFGYDFYFEFYGEIEKNGDRVKLYEVLSYGEKDDGGDGKCQPASNDCTLWFKWNIGRRSSAKGKLVTEFTDDAVQLTFGITGYFFPIGQQKLDFTATLQHSASASETCKLPPPAVNADLNAWVKYCSSL